MFPKTEKKKNLAAALACAAVYMVLLRCMVPFVYGIVDDRTMMEFVSGQYLGHPDPHTIFMGYWYSLFLTVLYRAVRNVDWYALCFLAVQGFSMGLIAYRVFGRCRSRKQKLYASLILLVLFMGLCAQATAQLSFTTTAAVLGITVIFMYETTEKLTWKNTLLLFLMIFITCEIRPDILYMILPVCVVLWFFRNRKEKIRFSRRLLIPAITVIVLALHAVGDWIGYGSEQWQAYEVYNQNRSAVYDFPDHTFLPYEGAEDLYHSVGIEKKSRARTLMNYNYTADDQITPDFFQTYIDAYNQFFPSGETASERIVRSAEMYVKGTFSGKYHWQSAFVLALYVVLGLWYLFRKQWAFFAKTAAALGVQVLLWIYLIYAGRTPDRVVYSMNLMMTVTVLLLWLEAFRTDPPHFKAWRFCVLAAFLGVCILSGARLQNIRKQNRELAHWNENVEDLKAYCMSHPDHFYFNDVTSLAFTTWNVRLWRPEPYVMNYMSLGNWMSFSPIWAEKLSTHGITSVKEALYGQENVYLICSFDKGLEYLELLYDDVTCEEVDKISGFHIYKLRIVP